MKNNIYVGNRYVPVFADPVEWDNLRSYEPLTIVTYQGTSYTSKKAVPAGINLDNAAYWVATGNYNAQVEAYRQDVESYKEQCDDYAEKSLDYYKSTNKNVLLFGDSYGMADGQGGWCSKTKNLLTGMGCSCDYLARSGYGFVSADGTLKFISEIADYANNMTAAQKEAITDVVIGGGWNDNGKTQTDIITDMNACLSYCKTTFPNAKIWVAFMAFDTQYDILTNLMVTIEPAYRVGALQNGCFYMTNLPYITHNTNNMADTRHPNDAGYTLIARMVAEYLINGESNADMIRVPMNITLIPGVSNPEVSNAYQFAHNGIVETYINSNRFVIEPGAVKLKFNLISPVKIANVKGCVVGDPLWSACVDTQCTVSLSGISGFVYTTMRFIISNNELWVLPLFAEGVDPNIFYDCTSIYTPLIRMFTNMTLS